MCGSCQTTNEVDYRPCAPLHIEAGLWSAVPVFCGSVDCVLAAEAISDWDTFNFLAISNYDYASLLSQQLFCESSGPECAPATLLSQFGSLANTTCGTFSSTYLSQVAWAIFFCPQSTPCAIRYAVTYAPPPWTSPVDIGFYVALVVWFALTLAMFVMCCILACCLLGVRTAMIYKLWPSRCYPPCLKVDKV
jgi:hypothetical protein